MDTKKLAGKSGLDSRQPGFWNRQATYAGLERRSPETTTVHGDTRPARQRVGIRKAVVPCNILVKAGASFVLARRIHDISLVGAFVEMDTTDLAAGEIVDIVIDFALGDRQVEHQLSAEISRVEDHGVGLKFNAYGNRTYTDLVNLLYAG